MNLLQRMGRLPLLLIISCSVIVSCKKDDEATRSNAKSILKFSVDTISATIDESAHTVKLTVPYNFDLKTAKPAITISPEATISPASGTTVDLSSSVTYKVKAADGSEQAYTVSATKKASNSIESFVVSSGETVTAVINDTTHTITITGSFLYNNWLACKPVIRVTSGATIYPASEEQVNLHHVSKYTVTGADNKVQEYTVKLLNTDNMILGLRVSVLTPDLFDRESPYAYVRTAATYRDDLLIAEHLDGITTANAGLFYVTTTDDLSNITFKSVKLPDGATASPSFDVPQNFNKDVIYTITSMAGTTSQITIRAIKQQVSTSTAMYPVIYSGFVGVDQAEIMYRLSDTTQISQFAFIEDGGTEYPASVTSDEVNENGIHNCYYKSNTTLPKGIYRTKLTLKNGTSMIDRSVISKQ